MTKYLSVIFLSLFSCQNAENNNYNDGLIGVWQIEKIQLQEMSAMDNEAANKFLKKNIVITEKQFITPASDTCYFNTYTSEQVVSSDDVEKLASAKIDSMYEYTFPCKKGYEEHIYLVKQQYLIYEVDGVLFLATKKSK